METKQINLDMIVANPNQPRKHFDEQTIKELSESIKKEGLMQPITVRKVSHDTFEIVQGERRYRAAKLAGLDEVNTFVQDLNDEEAFHLAVIENIQREDMTPIEEAQAFMKYVEMGYTHEEIANKVSKSRTYVTTRLRLLNLIPEIQDMIAKGKISEGQAKVILSAKNGLAKILDCSPFLNGTWDSFEFIQKQFINRFKEEEKITVNDVKEFLNALSSTAIRHELMMLWYLAQSESIEEEFSKKLTEKNKEQLLDNPSKKLIEARAEVINTYNNLLGLSKEMKQKALSCMATSMQLGAYFTNFTKEAISDHFALASTQKDENTKTWEIYKAEEEWQELLSEVKELEIEEEYLGFSEIIELIKRRDLSHELSVF